MKNTTKKINLAILIISTFLFIACSSVNNKTMLDSNLLDLNGKNYTLKIDKKVMHPKTSYSSDSEKEAAYKKPDKKTEYQVSFSKNGETVTIIPGSITGKIQIQEDQSFKRYRLSEGLFAGGELNISVEEKELKAEYTILGSGVPIISIERGKLEILD